MGVYIPDMDMPTTCYDCPLTKCDDFAQYCCVDGEVVDDEFDESNRTRRRPGCPLVSVDETELKFNS